MAATAIKPPKAWNVVANPCSVSPTRTVGVKMVFAKDSWVPPQMEVLAPTGCFNEPHYPAARSTNRPNDLSAAEAPPRPRDLLTADEERVMTEHLPTVRFIARRIHERLPPHVSIEDLYSAGVLGLLDAFGKFDSFKQVKFVTYAQFRIRGAILDSLRTLDWSPRELRRKGRAVEQAIQELIGQLTRSPTDIEIAHKLNMPLAVYQQLLWDLKGLEIGTLHAERSADSEEEELVHVRASRRRSSLPLLGWGDAGASDQGHQRPARTRAAGRDALLLRGNDHEGDRTYHRCRGIPGIANSRLSRSSSSCSA
jgi:RNA polymerase sigma factor (sigma-70 family)